MIITELDGRVRVALSDKTDGNMRAMTGGALAGVEKNRRLFLERAGIGYGSSYLVRVSYDTEDYCQFMTASENNSLPLGEDAARCDGLLTREPGRAIFLPLADCLGVVMYDTQNEMMMVVHCGAHTTIQRGAYRAVQYMVQAGTLPENILVWLSPSVGKESYPVYALDGIGLQEAVVGQLAEAGVRESNIRQSNIDTATDERYFSHSQGDRQERFAIAAVID